MSKILIQALNEQIDPIDRKGYYSENEHVLKIAEMFSHTIQGEGINAGHPATFIRLQNCTLACHWCDTISVWKKGNPYPFREIFDLLRESGAITALERGQHLVLTGGSPLLQQEMLVKFIEEFIESFDFRPFIEVENEAVIMPTDAMVNWVDCWNNSPKLSNSGMKEKIRYKPEVLRRLSSIHNSWFKFVIQNEGDWKEVLEQFIQPGLIRRDQVILMPEGQTQEELAVSRPIVADLCVQKNVRFSDRLHITLWDKKTGV